MTELFFVQAQEKVKLWSLNACERQKVLGGGGVEHPGQTKSPLHLICFSVDSFVLLIFNLLQVHERATHLGSGLVNLGCEPSQNTFVGIYGPNSIEVNN